MPLPEERLELVRMKATALKAELPADVLQLIAEMPFETIRELEGGLNQVLARSQLSKQAMTVELAHKALTSLRNASKKPSPQQIIDAVCSHFKISREQLSGPSRARDITYPRHVAIYLLRRFGPYALTDIGHLLGGRDHSTVISAFKRIQRELNSFPDTQADVRQLEQVLATTSVA
jgi:chromosomal replication initiator protein